MGIFDEVKAQVNIRQVVEYYGFRVDRAGKFICPFHNDHSPSASIKKDYFNCFVCGAGGDAITFTAKYLGLSNLDAAKELIKTFNLPIDVSTPEERREQWKAEREQERKRKKELQKCSSLRERFAKDKQHQAERKKYANYRLRNEIKKDNAATEERDKAYIKHCGNILEKMHHYLKDGVYNSAYGSEKNTRGCQGLAICEYWLDCYYDDPRRFSIEGKGVVEGYERSLNLWDRQDDAV